jgi:osmotically-inducible protein OsmY
VLRNTTTVDDATVSVAVHGGTVVLAGTVADRRELRRVLDLVANVVGVRGTMNSLVVSSSARHEDRTAARRLNALLSSRFPGEGIEAKVFANVAVLSGTVSRLWRRHEIEKLVDQASSITRVVNKIDVA